MRVPVSKAACLSLMTNLRVRMLLLLDTTIVLPNQNTLHEQCLMLSDA